MSGDKVAIPFRFSELCRGARRDCRLRTSSDVSRVLVESNVLVTARTLEYLHLRSDVSSFPISSSQFLYTSIRFPSLYTAIGPRQRGGSCIQRDRYVDNKISALFHCRLGFGVCCLLSMRPV